MDLCGWRNEAGGTRLEERGWRNEAGSAIRPELCVMAHRSSPPPHNELCLSQGFMQINEGGLQRLRRASTAQLYILPLTSLQGG